MIWIFHTSFNTVDEMYTAVLPAWGVYRKKIGPPIRKCPIRTERSPYGEPKKIGLKKRVSGEFYTISPIL